MNYDNCDEDIYHKTLTGFQSSAEITKDGINMLILRGLYRHLCNTANRGNEAIRVIIGSAVKK
jgi:hypothetical protein